MDRKNPYDEICRQGNIVTWITLLFYFLAVAAVLLWR